MRVAVIGAGVIGRTHLEAIDAADGIALAGVVDPFPAGAELAGRYGAPHFAGVEELVAAGVAEAAIVGTPNDTHAAIGVALLEAGVPALIEKPIAGSLADARALVDAADRTGVPVLVGHHRRYHPVARRAKEIVESGALGRIVAASVTSFLAKPADYFDIAWHAQPGSGGTFLINLIHEIDLLRHLVGEITAVSAMASNAVRGLAVEDTGAVSFAFASGALGSLILSDTVAGPWSWDLSADDSGRFPVHPIDSHRLGGTDASLTIPTLQLWRHDGARSWTTPMRAEDRSVPREDPYAAQLAHLAAVTRRDAEPLVTARDGERNLRVLEAVTESARTGRTVRCD